MENQACRKLMFGALNLFGDYLVVQKAAQIAGTLMVGREIHGVTHITPSHWTFFDLHTASSLVACFYLVAKAIFSLVEKYLKDNFFLVQLVKGSLLLTCYYSFKWIITEFVGLNLSRFGYFALIVIGSVAGKVFDKIFHFLADLDLLDEVLRLGNELRNALMNRAPAAAAA